MSEEIQNKDILAWDTNINPKQFDLDFYKDEIPAFSIPEKGFLGQFVDYACRCSDAPIMFNLISGLTIMATVCDKLFYQFGDNQKKLHIWAVLIADTNFFRKSQAASSALKILGMISPEKENNRLYPTDFSLEKLMMELAEKPSGVFFFDEWGGTLARWEKSYNGGLKEFVTQMYEGGYFKRKLKSSDDITISNPHICMLCCSTMEWWEKYSTENDIAGGFSNRFLYCWIKKKARTWDFPPYEISPCEQIVLRDNLYMLSKIEGQVVFSKEARQIYRNYYFDFEDDFEKKEGAVKNLYARIPLFCLKLACLYALNNHSNNITVEKLDMEQAICLSKWLLSSSYENATEKLFIDPFYKKNCAILAYIKKGGYSGREKKDIYFTSKLKAKFLDEHLDTLEKSGKVRIGEKKSLHDKTVYYANI